MKFLTPLIIIGFAAGILFWFTKPQYSQLQVAQANQHQLQDMVAQADTAIAKRNALVEQFKNFPPEDLDKLQALLPDHSEGVRQLIDINTIAAKYNATIKNISVDDVTNGAASSNSNTSNNNNGTDNKAYGVSPLSFSVDMTYSNFLSFLADLEQNLRLTDISAAEFKPSENGVYTYNIKAQTYWLK